MKDSMLIMSENIASERLFYSAIKGVVNMESLETELMEHIDGCDDCRVRYTNYFLKE